MNGIDIRTFTNVLFLILNYNNITTFCDLQFSSTLLKLNINFNKVTKITENCLQQLKHLQMLLLQKNKIETLESKCLNHLDNLKVLNISSNPLIHLETKLSEKSLDLKVLYLTNVSLSLINPTSFESIQIKTTITDDYHICCLLSKPASCSASKP